MTQAFTSGGYLWLKDQSRVLAGAQNIAKLGNPYIQSVYARLRTAKGYAYRRIDVAPTLLQPMGVPHQRMQGLPLADAMDRHPPGLPLGRRRRARSSYR